MKTKQQKQTEGHGWEALRLMKELAKMQDPKVREAYWAAIKESDDNMRDSFADELLDDVREGKITTEEVGKILRKLDKGQS
jgi:hypothetical protein